MKQADKILNLLEAKTELDKFKAFVKKNKGKIEKENSFGEIKVRIKGNAYFLKFSTVNGDIVSFHADGLDTVFPTSWVSAARFINKHLKEM
jgi:hypothetical protein